MMRILHMATRHTVGGGPRNINFTIEWEKRHGHDVEFAVGREFEPSNLPSGTPLRVIESMVRNINPWLDRRAPWSSE